jgi:hypothetical protein
MSIRSTNTVVRSLKYPTKVRRRELDQVAVAARLQVPLGSFHLDVDCPIDMDPEITPEVRAEIDRRIADHEACPHDWRLMPDAEAETDFVARAFADRGLVASRCTVCGELSLARPNRVGEQEEPPR